MHRIITAVALSALTIGLGATAASAHVTLNPREVPKGSFANFEVRVPTERPDASTTKVELFFPEDNPLPNVSVMPHERWDYEIERRELDEPFEVFGEEFTEVVAKITWEGGKIKPGEFDEMEISVGPIPDDVDQLVFRAVQTYDSGEVVRWAEVAEEGAEEPELPAPIVTLIDAADESAPAGEATEAEAPEAEATEAAAGAAASAVQTASAPVASSPLAVAALVAAVLALAVAVAALVRGRGTSAPS